MTINNKLGLSLLASAVIAASASAACTLPGTGTGCTGTLNVAQGGTISQELLAVGDTNVSVANFTFIPKFDKPSTRNNPVFEFAVTPTNVTGDVSQYAVYKVDLNTSTNSWEYNKSAPATNTGVISNGVVTFSASGGSTVVQANEKYQILSINGDGNASNPVNFAAVNVLIKTPADAANTSVCANVYTGDTGAFLSGACKTPLYSVVPEYKIQVTKSFNRRTNLCSGKVVFDTSAGGCGGDNNKTDNAMFQIVRTPVTYPFSNDTNNSYLKITADTNLTVVSSVNPGAYSGAATNLAADFNVSHVVPGVTSTQTSTFKSNSLAAATAPAHQTLEVVYEVNTSSTIPDTKFNWEFVLASTAGNTSAAGSASSGALGEWKPFGYAAQIPNVSTVNGGHDVETTVIVTNTSSSDADVFFTLVDAGNECLVSTANTALNAVPANSSMKYKATALKALCPTIGATFGLELDIAINPQDVYTAASFKNTGKNLFKDLPVYSTSKMSY